MILLGALLLILGFVLGFALLWIIGLVLVVLGLVFWFAPGPVGGRRWY